MTVFRPSNTGNLSAARTSSKPTAAASSSALVDHAAYLAAKAVLSSRERAWRGLVAETYRSPSHEIDEHCFSEHLVTRCSVRTPQRRSLSAVRMMSRRVSLCSSATTQRFSARRESTSKICMSDPIGAVAEWDACCSFILPGWRLSADVAGSNGLCLTGTTEQSGFTKALVRSRWMSGQRFALPAMR